MNIAKRRKIKRKMEIKEGEDERIKFKEKEKIEDEK